jgi:limonene-1,2-epoxide hydrolase
VPCGSRVPGLVGLGHCVSSGSERRHRSRLASDAPQIAVSGDLVIAEQIHGLGLPGKQLAAIKNLAVYELRDDKIAAWRDYTNPQKAGQLLGL